MERRKFLKSALSFFGVGAAVSAPAIAKSMEKEIRPPEIDLDACYCGKCGVIDKSKFEYGQRCPEIPHNILRKETNGKLVYVKDTFGNEYVDHNDGRGIRLSDKQGGKVIGNFPKARKREIIPSKLLDIHYNGRVGLGNVNPSTKLHVYTYDDVNNSFIEQPGGLGWSTLISGDSL